jgi:hypothetical protein
MRKELDTIETVETQSTPPGIVSLLPAFLLAIACANLSFAPTRAVAATSSAAATSYHQTHGTSDELSGVVVLCATEPGSANFNAAWTRWLDNNPSADIDQAIDTVLGKARTIRSMAMGGIEPTAVPNRLTNNQIAAHMRDLASRRMRNLDSPRIRVISVPES